MLVFNDSDNLNKINCFGFQVEEDNVELIGVAIHGLDGAVHTFFVPGTVGHLVLADLSVLWCFPGDVVGSVAQGNRVNVRHRFGSFSISSCLELIGSSLTAYELIGNSVTSRDGES